MWSEEGTFKGIKRRNKEEISSWNRYGSNSAGGVKQR
jgi:hypothetical protein